MNVPCTNHPTSTALSGARRLFHTHTPPPTDGGLFQLYLALQLRAANHNNSSSCNLDPLEGLAL